MNSSLSVLVLSIGSWTPELCDQTLHDACKITDRARDGREEPFLHDHSHATRKSVDAMRRLFLDPAVSGVVSCETDK